MELWERAKAHIPGGVNSPVRAFASIGVAPRFIAEAHGAWLTDVEGKRYMDYVCSWGPMILGHDRAEIRQAVVEAAGRGLAPEQLVADTVTRWFGGLEDAFRVSVCQTARLYLGAEYRWGGKSSRGIDCSGLVSAVYMQNGVLIYRDAQLRPGWPVHEIAFEAKKPGDLLFFPGHIAIYLGGNKYIHSTGAAASDGVVINSLDPADPRYRADLPERITAVGSIF